MIRTRALFVSIFVLSLAAMQLSGRAQPFSREVVFESGPEEHGGQITSRYDGFNHETVVTLKKMKVTCAGKRGNFKNACVSIVAALHCPGIQLDYVRHATLQLVFETKDWDQRHPLDQRELSVVANAETLHLGRMELLAQKFSTLTSETLQIKVPYATFRKMALAETVELQVGASRFELREKNLDALRDLNNRVKFAKRDMRSAN
jgi:hypothetical protein